MKKKIVIICVIILILIIPIGIIKLNSNKENNSYTIETYIDGKLALALPSSGSGYEFESITCNNGGIATFNYSTWRVEVKDLNGKTKCTVKFKSSDKPTLANYLKTNANLVEEYGYRYEGAKVNNYVLFNDELWRIIGVFNVETENSKSNQELVKLIRANVLDGLVWNGVNSFEWEGSTLQKSLNNGYLNKENEQCYYSTDTKTCNFGETGLNTGAREKIESVKWNIGFLVFDSSGAATVDLVRNNEITEQTTGYYKVGLMSPSDYMYAVSSDICSRSSTLNDLFTLSCGRANWLNSASPEFALNIAYDDVGSIGPSYCAPEGFVYYTSSAFYTMDFRPSVYLKSSVLYISGDGTHDNPFIIG